MAWKPSWITVRTDPSRRARIDDFDVRSARTRVAWMTRRTRPGVGFRLVEETARLTRIFRSVTVVSDNVPLAISKEIIRQMSKGFADLDFAAHKLLADTILRKTQPRIASFEECVLPVRVSLAKRLGVEEGNWSESAAVLSEIHFQPTTGSKSEYNLYKLEITLITAVACVFAGDLGNAESHINKTLPILWQIPEELRRNDLLHFYHASLAKILDQTGKFMDAATRYFEMHRLEQVALDQAVQLDKSRYVEWGMEEIIADDPPSIVRSAICLILAPSGSQRTRLLQNVYKAFRSKESPIFPLLEKIYLNRVLRAHEVRDIAPLLSSHHIEVRADGLSALQRAMMEHNIVSMSKVYENIGFAQLGALLGVSAVQAEKMAAKLISDGRLLGHIDQVDQYMYFASETEPMDAWEKQVVDVSLKLNSVVERIV